VKTYQALNQRLSGVLTKGLSSFSDMRSPLLRLGNLGSEEQQLLTDTIVNIHKTAYGWNPKISSKAVKNWAMLTLNKETGKVNPVNTREFIIKLIEILDILEQNPGYNLFNSELKVVTRNGVEVFVNTLPKHDYDS